MTVLTLSDIPSILGVLFVSALVFMLVQSRYRRWEVRVMLVSMAAHVIFAVYKLWLTVEVYGVGDVLAYHRIGQEIALLLRNDFWGVAPEVLKMLFQQYSRISLPFAMGSETTQSMYALTGIAVLLVGDSLIALCIAFSLASFFGKIYLYEMFRAALDRHYHMGAAVAALLVPSVIMWSAGIIKEGVAIIGLGLTGLAFVRLLKRVSPREVSRLLAGSLIMALVKPHLLVVFVAAAGVWWYWHEAAGRGGIQLKPAHLVLGLGFSVGGMLVLGEVFPRFALENLHEEAVQTQFYAARQAGGSTYALGDFGSRSPVGQLAYVPLALFTALYRPLIFEARNVQMLLSALETTLLLAMTLRLFWRQSPRKLVKRVLAEPLLLFCLVLTVVVGTMTGLTSANLGTLNRYRMPMMPFFVALLYLLSVRGRVSVPRTSAPAGSSRRSRTAPPRHQVTATERPVEPMAR